MTPTAWRFVHARRVGPSCTSTGANCFSGTGLSRAARRRAVRARPPGWPIMYQHWGQLLFLHWPLSAESLRPLIPDPLVIDTFDGAAWIGITPFTMWGVRPAFLPPIPVLSESHEPNARADVQRDGGRGMR